MKYSEYGTCLPVGILDCRLSSHKKTAISIAGRQVEICQRPGGDSPFRSNRSILRDVPHLDTSRGPIRQPFPDTRSLLPAASVQVLAVFIFRRLIPRYDHSVSAERRISSQYVERSVIGDVLDQTIP